ncbi:MAG TPA: hypothetical protein VNH84_05455 [Candidatus Saccharimonadales bacterium]|nr:hypothetical protein [Candidatus Saccharimonadales bacterium]
MRAYPFIVALLACAVISGCSRSGDFSAFVVSEVAKHGGHTVTNAMIPALEARWTIKSDTNGFQASVTGASFASIDAVMQQAFGTPKMSVAANASGQPHRVWGAVDIGVAIQLIGRPDGADIICVRGMRNMGEMLQSVGGRQ